VEGLVRENREVALRLNLLPMEICSGEPKAMEQKEGDRSPLRVEGIKANDAVKSDIQEARSSADSKLNWYIVKLTLAAGIGGLLFGYDTGIQTLPNLKFGLIFFPACHMGTFFLSNFLFSFLTNTNNVQIHWFW